jgi:hypothetical protein
MLHIPGMNTPITLQQLLSQIAQIQRMERGKLRIMRQGSDGPYYHLQSWENGRNFNRYVPREQLAAYEEALAGYQKFLHLIEQYAHGVIEKTRAELAASKKKSPPRPRFSSPRIRKSRQ